MVPTELCDSCHGKLWKLKAEGIHGGEGETVKDYTMQKSNAAFSEGFCTKQQQHLLIGKWAQPCPGMVLFNH